MSIADAIAFAKSVDRATAENIWLYLRRSRVKKFHGVVPDLPDCSAQPRLFSVSRQELIAAITGLHQGLRRLDRPARTPSDPFAIWAIPPGTALLRMAWPDVERSRKRPCKES